MAASAALGDSPWGGCGRSDRRQLRDAIRPRTPELGIDIIKVARIRETLERFGARFSRRVLTPAEQRYVRDRPETFAGRWAAKEAVSKVLGLGVRGIGWRDIEVERLPTGQPAVRLHGRAAQRAEQLGMDRIALSITHESDYAVAIAFGVRTAGWAVRLPARHRGSGWTSVSAACSPGWSACAHCTRRRPRTVAVAERPVGFARRGSDAEQATARRAGESDPVLDDRAVAVLLPDRPARGHKGTFGKLLVIAGSLDYAGAALLVCRAAGRAGAGLVTLAVPESLQPLFAAKVVEATTMALPEDDVEEVDPEPALARIFDHEHDAIVVGPGLRPGLATTELVRELIVAGEDTAAPIVLDAEALRSMATLGDWWSGASRPAVLTPHPGEFARLRAGAGADPAADGDLAGDDAARAAAARDAAATWGQVVVLKGARTVIAEPDGTVSVAPFENPALASGGTGDVLAGVIGALLAQGLRPADAARLGVYLHGMAGESVRERLGDAGLLASDLPGRPSDRTQAAGRGCRSLRPASGSGLPSARRREAPTERPGPPPSHRGRCPSAAASRRRTGASPHHELVGGRRGMARRLPRVYHARSGRRGSGRWPPEGTGDAS